MVDYYLDCLFSVQETWPQIFGDIRRVLTTRQITLTSLSRRQPIAIDYRVTLH